MATGIIFKKHLRQRKGLEILSIEAINFKIQLNSPEDPKYPFQKHMKMAKYSTVLLWSAAIGTSYVTYLSYEVFVPNPK